MKILNLNAENEVTCLVGDLNFDCPGKDDLTNYLSWLNISQMVKKAIHLDGHILDHVYVPEKLANLVEIKNYYVNYSDHDAIMVDLKKDTSLPEPYFQFIAWKIGKQKDVNIRKNKEPKKFEGNYKSSLKILKK